MRVRVYYNTEKDAQGYTVAWIDGYKPGHHLAHIMSVDLMDDVWSGDSDHAICERVWRQMNRVDGNEMISQFDLPVRSMSVGDVVAIGPTGNARWYAAAGVGFEAIDEPLMNDVLPFGEEL